MSIKSEADKAVETSLDKRVTRLEVLMRKVLACAEIHWGKDIDGDGKVGWARRGVLAFLAVALIAVSVWAVDFVNYGATDYWTTAGALVTSGSITAGGGLVAGGDITLGSAETLDWNVPTAVAVTNAEPVTLADGVNQLTMYGQVNGETGTVTLAPVSAADVGKQFVIVASSGATNLLAIAKTGTWIGPAVELAAGEMAFVIAIATNQFVGISQ